MHRYCTGLPPRAFSVLVTIPTWVSLPGPTTWKNFYRPLFGDVHFTMEFTIHSVHHSLPGIPFISSPIYRSLVFVLHLICLEFHISGGWCSTTTDTVHFYHSFLRVHRSTTTCVHHNFLPGVLFLHSFISFPSTTFLYLPFWASLRTGDYTAAVWSVHSISYRVLVLRFPGISTVFILFCSVLISLVTICLFGHFISFYISTNSTFLMEFLFYILGVLPTSWNFCTCLHLHLPAWERAGLCFTFWWF